MVFYKNRMTDFYYIFPIYKICENSYSIRSKNVSYKNIHPNFKSQHFKSNYTKLLESLHTQMTQI